MRVEIPPEAVDALARSLEGRLIVSRIDRHYAAWHGLQAALPHLFAAWSERLTSDEAIEAGALALAREVGEEFVFDLTTQRAVTALAYRLSARKTLDAALAALSSVSGKDAADG